MRRLLNYPPLVVKLLRSLTPLTKILGWHEKIAQDLQLRQIYCLIPEVASYFSNGDRSEIEAE